MRSDLSVLLFVRSLEPGQLCMMGYSNCDKLKCFNVTHYVNCSIAIWTKHDTHHYYSFEIKTDTLLLLLLLLLLLKSYNV